MFPEFSFGAVQIGAPWNAVASRFYLYKLKYRRVAQDLVFGKILYNRLDIKSFDDAVLESHQQIHLFQRFHADYLDGLHQRHPLLFFIPPALILSFCLVQGNTKLYCHEFTDMIITQRGFQSNSKIITTSDEMLETLINIKR